MEENYIRCDDGDYTVVKFMNESATIVIAKEFKAYLFEMIESGRKKIILDLEKTNIMDSTFLGALVLSFRKVAESGGTIVLAALSESVSLTLGLTKLINVFQVFSSVEDAKEQI